MLRLFWLLATSMWSTFWRRRREGPRRPSWTFQFQALVEFLARDWAEMKNWPVTRTRADLESRFYPRSAQRRVCKTRVDAGGVPGMWFEPPRITHQGTILYLHGGSYLFGSFRTHGDVMARVALATGMRVLGIEYRLAPEHPYPCALEDALRAYRWLAANVATPDRLAVAGESAGGNLTAVLLMALRDAGEPLPAASVIISPWLDLESKSASIETNAMYDYGDKDMLVAQARLFAGDVPLVDPRVSPFHAELVGLSSMLVQVGEAECLVDECREWVRRAAEAGVDVTLDVLPDMPHAAQLLAEYAPEGQRAIERAATFINARIQ